MIDIIVPVYNDERLFRLINSVLKSKSKIFTRLIIIEASKNFKFHEKIKNTIRDSDILVLESDDGIFDGFNKGLKLSTNKALCIGC